jgi:methyl-accepting chemotaxis protein
MVGFAIVLVLAAGQSLFAVYGTTQLSQNSSEIANEWLPGTYYNGTLGTHISRMRTLQFQFVGSFSQTDRLTLENALTDEITTAGEALQSYAKLSHGGPEAAHFEAVQKHWVSLNEQHKTIMDLARQRRDEEALDLIRGDSRASYMALMQELAKLSDIAKAGATKARDTSAMLQSIVFYGNLIALAITILLGVFIARSLCRSISGGVNYAAHIATKVAQGDLTTRIVPNTRDEVGLLLLSIRDSGGGSSAQWCGYRVQRQLGNCIGQPRPQLPHRKPSQLFGANRFQHGRAELHHSAKRRERQASQPAGPNRTNGRTKRRRGGGRGGGHHEGHQRQLAQNCRHHQRD